MFSPDGQELLILTKVPSMIEDLYTLFRFASTLAVFLAEASRAPPRRAGSCGPIICLSTMGPGANYQRTSTLWAVSFPLCDEDEQEAVLGCLYINAALIKPADRRLLGALHVHGLPGGSCATSSSDPLLHAPAKAKAAVNLNEAANRDNRHRISGNI